MLALPLASCANKVYCKGKAIGDLKGSDRNGSGVLRISIGIPSIDKNACGWLYQLHRSIFGHTVGKRIWVMFFDRKLYYYDGPWGIDSELFESPIDCSTIKKVAPEVYKRMEITTEGLRITYKNYRKRDLLMWGCDSIKIQSMWLTAFSAFVDTDEPN